MKKYLPFVILGAGILVFVIAFFVIRSRGGDDAMEEEEGNLIELSLAQMPVVSLTPTEDGHYLNLNIDKIKVPGAVTMDFQFLYDVPDKVQQGSSGDDIDITSGSFETELLLGSESAGKFRYDEGVENGNLMLWFRDKDKKLVTKVETDFHMQTGVDELISNDGKFKYTPNDPDMIFITMNTLGVPDGYDFNTDNLVGPYGVFSSTSDNGEAGLDGENIYVFNNKWEKSNKGLGIYVLVN